MSIECLKFLTAFDNLKAGRTVAVKKTSLRHQQNTLVLLVVPCLWWNCNPSRRSGSTGTRCHRPTCSSRRTHCRTCNSPNFNFPGGGGDIHRLWIVCSISLNFKSSLAEVRDHSQMPLIVVPAIHQTLISGGHIGHVDLKNETTIEIVQPYKITKNYFEHHALITWHVAEIWHISPDSWAVTLWHLIDIVVFVHRNFWYKIYFFLLFDGKDGKMLKCG